MQKFRPLFALLLGLLVPFFMFLLTGTSMRFVFLLAAAAYFALGMFFSRDASYSFWGKGVFITGPFVVLILLFAWNRWPLYLLPLAALASTYWGLYFGRLWPAKMRFWHIFLTGVWLLAVVEIGFFLLPRLVERSLTKTENTPAPEFELQTLDSLVVKSSDLRGKVVVLDFWATWCGPCLKQFPELQQLYDKFAQDPRVVFLAVNTSWGKETPEKARQFIESNGYTFPVAFDTGGQVAAKFGVRSIPHTVVIDTQGVIRLRHVGFVESTGDFFRDMSAQIEALLQQKE